MKKSSGTSILFAFLLVTLVGCSKQADTSQTTTSGPNTTKTEPQPNEPQKPKLEKKIPINEIDFSKHPGVIRPAAFGYYFGLTSEQIQKAGIELESTFTDNFISVYMTNSAPMRWDGAEKYKLIFFKDTLLKIVAIGVTITGDPTGSQGKEIYKELVAALTEKYGKPSTSFHKTGNRLYQARDEFYQCLAYSGCGMWVDSYELPDREIFVDLQGGGRDTGRIHLTYEANPEWSQALDQQKAHNKEVTKKGL